MAADGTQQTSKFKVERRGWSDEEFEALLRLLEEAIALGKRADAGQFKPGTFKWLKQKLESKFPEAGIKVKPHIESIMRRLKTEYSNIYDMLNTSGFGRDDVTKKIVVDSDDVWNAYKASKSDVNLKNYRIKTFPYYDRLVIIFGKDHATGKGAEAPGDVLEELNEEEHPNETNSTPRIPEEVIELSDDDSPSLIANQSKNKSKFTNSESQRVCKRSRGEDILAASMDKFADKLVDVVGKSADRMGDMAESVKSIAEGVKVVKDFYDDSRAIADELMKLENLTLRERNKASRLLMQNISLIHLFWGFQAEHRVQFVKDLLEDN